MRAAIKVNYSNLTFLSGLSYSLSMSMEMKILNWNIVYISPQTLESFNKLIQIQMKKVTRIGRNCDLL